MALFDVCGFNLYCKYKEGRKPEEKKEKENIMNQSSPAPAYKKVSAREKYAFGIGAIGKDAICNMVGSFLMLYFTDTLFLAPPLSESCFSWPDLGCCQ